MIKVINKGPMRLRAFKGLPKERRILLSFCALLFGYSGNVRVVFYRAREAETKVEKKKTQRS